MLWTVNGQLLAQHFGALTYPAGWLDETGFDPLVRGPVDVAGLAARSMPEGVRIRDTAAGAFWFNYSGEMVATDAVEFAPAAVMRQPL